MTPEDEAAFRIAARTALDIDRSVVMVTLGDADLGVVPLFSVVTFQGGHVGIIVPDAWEADEESFCQAILRQEEKALDGQSLD